MNFKTRTDKFVTLSSIYKILKNHFYHGMFESPRGSGKWYKGAHEPLITKELFNRVQEQLNMPDRPQYGQKEFQFTRMFKCGGCGSGITAEEKIKRNKGNGYIHRYVYYRCTQAKDRSCQEPPMREKDILDQLLKMIDEIDIDQIGAKKRIEKELDRYRAFTEGVLGEKIVKPKQREVNVRKYAKHVLTNGSREEKCEILEYLQNAITIKDRILKIEKRLI